MQTMTPGPIFFNSGRVLRGLSLPSPYDLPIPQPGPCFNIRTIFLGKVGKTVSRISSSTPLTELDWSPQELTQYLLCLGHKAGSKYWSKSSLANHAASSLWQDEPVKTKKWVGCRPPHRPWKYFVWRMLRETHVMVMLHYNHRQVSMVLADDLAPIWRQVSCNHH